MTTERDVPIRPNFPPYSACAVADLLLQEALDRKISDMTNMKINKLVYIAHGWHLGIFNSPLVEDPIEAWQHGPVIASLYYWVKYTHEKSPGDAIKEEDRNLFKKHRVSPTETVEELTKLIVGRYGDMDAWVLSELTHKKGSPWKTVTKKHLTSIPDRLIQDYYGTKLGF